MSDVHLVLIGGRAGSGKSTTARELSRQTGFAVFDKDTMANPLTEKLLDAAYHLSGDDRDSPAYLHNVRPREYRSMMDTVVENIDNGVSCIAVAPFGPEFRDAAWRADLQQKCGENVTIHYVQMTVPDDVLKQWLIERGSPRDQEKLANWDRFVSGAKAAGSPLQPYCEFDASVAGNPSTCAQEIIEHCKLPTFLFPRQARRLTQDLEL